MDLRVSPNPNANLRVTRVFLFCKVGAICAKNSPKRTPHGVARAIVKGTSLRSTSAIRAPGINGIRYPGDIFCTSYSAP